MVAAGSRITLLGSLVLASCLSIPGTEPGGPCNEQKICVEGLRCDREQNRCVTPEQVAWEQMTTTRPDTLHAVWGIGAEDLIAVGSNGVVLRYRTGYSQWEEDTEAQKLTGQKYLYDVWGRGNELWIAGSSIALYWNQGWKTLAVNSGTPPEPLQSFTLRALSGSGEAGVWAVGAAQNNKAVFAYGNGSWSVVADAGLTFDGNGLHVVGKHVFVAGHAQQVRMFDGSGWTAKSVGTEPLALKGLWGLAPDDLWAVGPARKLLHFDGEVWNPPIEAPDLPEARAIWGSAEGDYWVVGSAGYDGSSVAHCQGQSCYGTPVTADKSYGKALNGVWCSDDGTTVVAVGESSTIYRRRR